jgi:hypothetical protein
MHLDIPSFDLLVRPDLMKEHPSEDARERENA